MRVSPFKATNKKVPVLRITSKNNISGYDFLVNNIFTIENKPVKFWVRPQL